jgi:single-stranded DNA-binding protein
MFRFTIEGRIGRLETLKSAGLRISVAADRLADGPQGRYTRTEWLSCISFDANLVEQMRTDLDVGMSVKLDGRIEPRKREVEGKPVYDTSFFIERYERLSKPKPASSARAPANTAPAA